MRWSVLVVVLIGCGVDVGNSPDGGTDVAVADSGAAVVADGGAATEDAGVAAPIDAGSGHECGRCTSYGAVANAGVIAIPELTESSGLVASRAHPGVLYSHNDSGGRPVIYVLSTSGANLGELVLDGAANADWEDIAIGPCPTGTCIYVGEIGDNSLVNPGPYAVYRVTEPSAISATTSVGSMTATYERLPLSYPNGEKYNAETLMVHPVTGDLYVVTKPEMFKKSTAYKATAPFSALATNDLVQVATMAVPDGFDFQITAGDIDVCGTTMLIRTYNSMYQFTVAANASFDSIFTSSFTRVPAPVLKVQENQGEAVAWAVGGGYYTVSEGKSPMLHFIGCQ